MSFFEDYITNPHYIEAYGFDNKWLLYVEDESDIPFWEEIINAVFPEKYEVKPAVTGSENKRGKNHLEKLVDKLNEKFLIALDSDYDYTCQNGRLPESSNINTIKYILQTYTYSRESIQYSPTVIKKVISKVKYTIQPTLNIIEIIDIYSNISFEILTVFLYLREKNINIKINNKKFTEGSLVKTLRLPNKCKITDQNFAINYNLFKAHKLKVDNIKDQLQALIIDHSDFISFKSNLLAKGLERSNAYLFISGHLYEDFIHQVFEHIITVLLSKEISRLKLETSGSDLTDKILKLKSHFRNFCCYKTMIYQNDLDFSNYYIQKIYKDTSNILTSEVG
ncbi:DUF4435 domain-containing protein [Acinetobacter pittii]|uniref:DUF4435 domain-containing protein n=1 Tax=Acinetobacter pittii TaxID=48296 RepID=UPI0019513E55|nr:DUF4435 domain-containing protein [Acinetobacter pittii]QRQ13748.1 DUF4435 domain-containing protein [Acinetobacter pittii]